MSARARLEPAINTLLKSRDFTKRFLVDLAPEEWFWSPPAYITHIAWQIGHIAVAEYNLCLRRVRGRTTDDVSLISDAFLGAYNIGSQPVAGAAGNQPLEEIQRVFEAVHVQAIAELGEWDDAGLDVPLETPHPIFKSKLDAVEWSGPHELVHGGQIAMLRRLMGKPPLR